MHIRFLRLFLSGVFAFPLAAQISNASLTGLVTDASNSAVPNVKVTARSQATNLERAALTDQGGYYYFTSLRRGGWRRKPPPAFTSRLTSSLHIRTSALTRTE
ncbi:MAG: hypothetical protein C5B51_03045 [Terriglobia bacterium]|nr:MAG: hypothetical protein C5B51_03045 [Terriglobia bacterium]